MQNISRNHLPRRLLTDRLYLYQDMAVLAAWDKTRKTTAREPRAELQLQFDTIAELRRVDDVLN